MYTVLTVDDSSFMRTWIKRLLASNDLITTLEASSGLEAILTYRKMKPDLVILDYNMPELTGLEVLNGPESGHQTCESVLHLVSFNRRMFAAN